MTKVLVITNSEDVTVDYLEDKIGQEVNFVRFNTDFDLNNFSANWTRRGLELGIVDRTLNVDDISIVWYRRPKPFTLNTTTSEIYKKHAIEEWQEAIEGILSVIPTQKWINHPLSIKRASYKIEQLNRCSEFGLKAPSSLVTNSKEDLDSFHSEFDSLIIKPISHGYLEGSNVKEDKLLYTNSLTEDHISQFPENNFCPTLFQEKIDKAYDIRITVLDDQLVAVKLTNSSIDQIDIRRNNMAGVSYSFYQFPTELENAVIALVRSYGLRFAAIDFVKSKQGDYYFLEVNPNGQWAWIDIYGKTKIYSLFLQAFKSA